MYFTCAIGGVLCVAVVFSQTSLFFAGMVDSGIEVHYVAFCAAWYCGTMVV